MINIKRTSICYTLTMVKRETTRGRNDFLDFVLDQVDDLPNINYRRMFGAFGLYQEEDFFGIVSGDVLYLKTNEHTRKKFIGADMGCFRPSEKQVLKNYYEVPAHVLEQAEELESWVLDAIDVARGK